MRKRKEEKIKKEGERGKWEERGRKKERDIRIKLR